MPLPISHGFLGASIVAAIHPKINKFYSLPLIIGGVLANSADLDFVFVLLSGDKTWHRGFSHSMIFSLFIFFLFVYILGREKLKEAIAYGFAYFSHTILDYSTTKSGGGLELFWFFSDIRFGLRWIGLSEIPSKLSKIEIMKTAGMEFLIFGSLFLVVFLLRKHKFKRELSKN